MSTDQIVAIPRRIAAMSDNPKKNPLVRRRRGQLEPTRLTRSGLRVMTYRDEKGRSENRSKYDPAKEDRKHRAVLSGIDIKIL